MKTQVIPLDLVRVELQDCASSLRMVRQGVLPFFPAFTRSAANFATCSARSRTAGLK